MGFSDTVASYSREEIKCRIENASKSDFLHALSKKSSRSIDDFICLLSPWGQENLESLARLSKNLTLKRFGKTIQLFIPMYLSNECQNICTYCGFSYTNKISRTTLTDSQILEDAKVLKSMNFDHLLLVSGEANKTVNANYFANALRLLRRHFSHLSLEVQPLSTNEYKMLKNEGLHAVLVYQETYDKEKYKEVHPKGKKSNFEYRLDTPERIGEAEIHKIGLGVLLGLTDWRVDAVLLALHLQYLRKKFWKSSFSISFPRLRPASGVHHETGNFISDTELLQLITSFRLFDENVDLSLSTRESPAMRDNLLSLGITSMSAGSRTDPGGYSRNLKVLEQFEISDERTPLEVATRIKELGYEPVWKNWDIAYGHLEDEQRAFG